MLQLSYEDMNPFFIVCDKSSCTVFASLNSIRIQETFSVCSNYEYVR
jgi:hypothetical protein